MTENQLLIIWKKTKGHCHFCGDPVSFKKRGWVELNKSGYWEVDHVIQRHKGGVKSADNCLPACTRCNRLRWHRKGSAIRELLILGLIAKEEIKNRTKIGKYIKNRRVIRFIRNKSRRKIKVVARR